MSFSKLNCCQLIQLLDIVAQTIQEANASCNSMLVAPFWCDLRCCSQTVVVIKAVANPPPLLATLLHNAAVPLRPSESELRKKLFTIVELKNKVAELATQLAIAIGGNFDHFPVNQGILNLLDNYEEQCWSKNGMLEMGILKKILSQITARSNARITATIARIAATIARIAAAANSSIMKWRYLEQILPLCHRPINTPVNYSTPVWRLYPLRHYCRLDTPCIKEYPYRNKFNVQYAFTLAVLLCTTIKQADIHFSVNWL